MSKQCFHDFMQFLALVLSEIVGLCFTMMRFEDRELVENKCPEHISMHENKLLNSKDYC